LEIFIIFFSTTPGVQFIFNIFHAAAC
jgi:hypothetical protein